ncbi:putative quinol monooxygenase [Sphingomonas sp. TDK1]|uniref:putative quinol monooxygenase n=1 Tax=Sphingomonas sp. TDK1 TaxID=453247 RepID=UPI0007D99401|nr:putative quinol monooxygenase [Sphingomonas sp. TDK1]OAN58498.1 antibiotic biosynthesis monooxygenase [Sphingomonas sp. TDK1]
MIREIAQIEIDPARADDFEQAVAGAEPLFWRGGCLEFSLHRSIEKPGRYRLLVGWESVEAHNVDFRGSPDFQHWRAAVSPFFLSPPEVEHLDQILPRTQG